MTPSGFRSRLASPVAFLLVLAAAFVGAQILFRGGGGIAETPAYFAYDTVAAAMDESRETGKPVLAFATADWCGPCQGFKRGALADERVAGFLASSTVPVYIDVTDSHPEAGMLGVRSIPAVYVIGSDGTIIDSRVGSAGASGFLAWAREAVGRAGS